jgi:hypothetical protein
MIKLKAWIGMKLCELGLFILGLGPKDSEDRQYYDELIDHWRTFYTCVRMK